MTPVAPSDKCQSVEAEPTYLCNMALKDRSLQIATNTSIFIRLHQSAYLFTILQLSVPALTM